jgi:hypothetical protein
LFEKESVRKNVFFYNKNSGGGKAMRKKFIPIIGLIILIFFSCSLFNEEDTAVETYWSDGAIIDAASGSPSDIIEALEQANPGDNIRIPAGTFDFDESIYLDAGVNIVGAGRDETILQTNGELVNALFIVDGSNGLPVGFAHMKLIGDQQDDSDLMDDGIELRNGCQDFRITEVEFESFGQQAIGVNGNARGVIDNCRFINIYRPAIANFGYGVCVMGDGDDGWERPFILGDENAVFVEDSYFIGNRHAVASNNGSRYVFRYNLVEDNGGEGAWVQAIDAHGPGYGSSRGSRSYEVYNNTVDNANTTCWVAMYIRGGDGVIFNNNISGGISTAPIMLTNESGSEYPALDQIRELYVWENYYEDSLTVPTNWSPGDPRVVQEGRDYFNYERPDYTPYPYPHPLRDR